MNGDVGFFFELIFDYGDALKFSGETGLHLRCDRNMGIPFSTRQGNRPSSRVEEGEHAALLEL